AKTTFDVWLASVPADKKIGVIKVVREVKAGLGLAEAKTTFDVWLASVPADKKINVIKAVSEVKAGLGLAEAKALVEGAPKLLLAGANKADADAAAKKIEEAGGKVELK
ncbi:MAG: ribosomal protein L7/L12, partial [Verrucomicrobiota bacterium]